jgi:hypothetical protein
MSKNRSRKNKGGACGLNKQEGGKDKKDQKDQKDQKDKKGGKTRRMAKGPSEWNKKVMEVYRDMKKKDPSVKLGAAMKRASQMKKRGEL